MVSKVKYEIQSLIILLKRGVEYLHFRQKRDGPVIDWMFVSPQNSYFEALPPNVMVLEGEAFER